MNKNGQVSVNCYGIDKLLLALYKIMKDKKINITEIQNCKNNDDLKLIAKKYPLLNLFKGKKDFIVKNRIFLSNYILSCAKGDWLFGLFTLDSRRKKMIEEILKKYGVANIDLDKKLEEINKNIKGKTDQITSNFFDSVKPYKAAIEKLGFEFNSYFYNTTTIAIGNYLMNLLEVDSLSLHIDSKNIIMELSYGLNKGIEGLNRLYEEWTQILKDIEGDESEKNGLEDCLN